MRRVGQAVVVGAAIVAAIGAVGAPSTASSVPPASEQVDAVAAAGALVEQYTAAQPAVAPEPLASAPPSGLTLAMLTCGFPTCEAFLRGVEDAAAALGWEVEPFITDISPEAYAATWDRMLQSEPDLIAYTALLPNELVGEQLERAASSGAPMVAFGGGPAAPGVGAVYAGAAQNQLSGELMGAAAVADAATRGDVAEAVFVWDPNTEVVMGPVRDGFVGTVEAAGGAVAVLDVANGEIGRAVPGQVVSFLQSNPNTDYVAFTVADFAAGVPQALAAAGIEGARLLSRSPQAANLENVVNGDEWLHVAEEGAATGWRAVDGLTRLLAGAPVEAAPPGWHQVLTAASIEDPATALDVPGVPDAYLAAWQVAG